MVKVKVFCLVMGLVGLTWANWVDEPKDKLEVVGVLELPRGAFKVFVQDSFAYTTALGVPPHENDIQLFVSNVSNPALPETLGSCFMPGTPYAPMEIWVKDSFAYIAAGQAGMQIVDVSDPKSPKLIGSLNPGVFKVQVVDSFAYLAASDSGLYIENMSNPLEPKLAGRLYPPECPTLSIQWPYAYATKKWELGSGFNIINISNPALLYIVGGASDGNSKITVNGNYVYTGWIELWIVDVSDSIQPKTVALYPKEFGRIFSIFIDSIYAYIAAEYWADVPEALNGLIVLNVSNPSQPTLSVRYGGQYQSGTDVFVKDRLVYLCGMPPGLLILRHVIPGIGEKRDMIKPITLKLFPNLPNPFRKTTQIQFQSSKSGFVNLSVYDLSGRLLKTLVQNQIGEGMHTLYWDGRDNRGELSPTGVYFICIRTTGFSLTKKAILLK